MVGEYLVLAQRALEAAGDVAADRLLLSFNVVNAKSVEDFANDGEGERPIVVTASNRLLAKELIFKIEYSGCKSEDKVKDATYATAVERVLRKLQKLSFFVSVISAADVMPSLESASDALTHFEGMEFILLRSESEHAGLASENILKLISAIQRSGNTMCKIRQVEDYAMELTSITKEWAYRVAPRVLSKLSSTKAPLFDVWLVLHKHFVPLSTNVSTMINLHRGLAALEILEIVPLASVHTAMLNGCPLHASVAADQQNHANEQRVQTMWNFLHQQKAGLLVQCMNADVKEFYMLTPAESMIEGSAGFFIFHMASSEELLLPPETTQDQGNALTSIDPVEEENTLRFLRELPRQDYNPFRHKSGAIAASLKQFAPTAAAAAARTSKRKKTEPMEKERFTSHKNQRKSLVVAPIAVAPAKRRRKLL